jgi:hypothetical protein
MTLKKGSQIFLTPIAACLDRILYKVRKWEVRWERSPLQSSPGRCHRSTRRHTFVNSARSAVMICTEHLPKHGTWIKDPSSFLAAYFQPGDIGGSYPARDRDHFEGFYMLAMASPVGRRVQSLKNTSGNANAVRAQ